MIDDVAGALSMDGTQATQLAEILRFLNRAALWMAEMFDWPELRVNDASFTSDGSDSYDLSTEVSSTLLRVVDRSVRVSTTNLKSQPKTYMDMVDPARTTSADPTGYCFVSPTDFRLLPYGSDGETVYLDYIKYPTEITAALAAASQSFLPPRQELVIDGAIWRGERRLSLPSWEGHKEVWERSVQKAFDKGSLSRFSPRQVIPNQPWSR